MLVKKLYNFYRNIRSKTIVFVNKAIYRERFVFGRDFYVRKGFIVTIEEEGYARIGANVFFNNYCSLNSIYGIEIGDNCIFGENVHVYDHNHIYSNFDTPINKQGFNKGKVRIGNNCWIGSNVTILKGVTIGKHCVIGAHNVIYKDIPDNSLVVNRQSQTTCYISNNHMED